MPLEPQRVAAIEVSSEVLPDGAYVVVVQPTPDVAIPLERDLATRYALSVLAAVQYADYEAAVWSQLSAAKLGEAGARLALTTLRQERRPLDHAATAPLTFEPILSATTRRGMIRVLMGGAQVAQLETAAAAEHANIVLAMTTLAELDSLYFHWLRSAGVTEPTARHTITDVARHHTGWLADAARRYNQERSTL